jgi:hypothetical protein
MSFSFNKMPSALKSSYPSALRTSNNNNSNSNKNVNNNWIKTSNKNFPRNIKPGPIISSGGFGTVRKLTPGFVIKKMFLESQRNINIFMNEIRVGTMPGIKEVGPKIYAYRISGNVGQYIMDDLGNFLTLASFTRKMCPPTNHPIYTALKECLVKFYKITKGYHGDLHADNIAVVFNKDGSFKKIMIYDYGAHRPFKNNSSASCFEEYMNKINRNFKQNYKSGNRFWGVKIETRNNIQSFRPNSNMLRHQMRFLSQHL